MCGSDKEAYGNKHIVNDIKGLMAFFSFFILTPPINYKLSKNIYNNAINMKKKF